MEWIDGGTYLGKYKNGLREGKGVYHKKFLN